MHVRALCADRERTRRVLVIFPCFSDLQTVFTDFRTFCESLFWPLFDFFVTKPLLRAYISMSFDCSYFPLFLPLVSKNTGVRPEKVFKKSDFFTLKPRQKDLWDFGDFDGRRKTAFSGEIGRIFAVARLVSCLSVQRVDERAELVYCQGCKACPGYVQDALQVWKQKACDPFGFIYKASKVLKYSVLRSRITIR